MSIWIDPEKNETQALFDLYTEWDEKTVLEIGAGDGRLTWRYADKVASVLALEPDEGAHALAMNNRSDQMKHVTFQNIGFDKFTRQNKKRFDIALLAWSL